MKRDARLYLKDMFAAMRSIREFTEGMSCEQFIADDKTASAVLRKLEIIGEAARNMPDVSQLTDQCVAALGISFAPVSMSTSPRKGAIDGNGRSFDG